MPGPRPTNRSRAEVEIRAVQKKRLKLEAQLDETLNELAALAKKHMDDGTPAPDIALWIDSPAKPNGVTRQYVYKLIDERVPKDGPSEPKPEQEKPRPKPTIRPKITKKRGVAT